MTTNVLLDHSAAATDLVELELAVRFSVVLAPDVIRQVVRAARRDLDGEVPPEALAEFLHRLALQRLLDLHREGASHVQPSMDAGRGADQRPSMV